MILNSSRINHYIVLNQQQNLKLPIWSYNIYMQLWHQFKIQTFLQVSQTTHLQLIAFDNKTILLFAIMYNVRETIQLLILY